MNASGEKSGFYLVFQSNCHLELFSLVQEQN